MIGLSDGLMVPFTLAAGLCALKISSYHIRTVCLVMIVAGAITMAAGAFLTARKYEPAQRPFKAASVIGISYLIGGIICVLPFLFPSGSAASLKWSALLTLPILFVSGFVEYSLHGAKGWIGGLRILGTGSIAAACAYTIAHYFFSV